MREAMASKSTLDVLQATEEHVWEQRGGCFGDRVEKRGAGPGLDRGRAAEVRNAADVYAGGRHGGQGGREQTGAGAAVGAESQKNGQG